MKKNNNVKSLRYQHAVITAASIMGILAVLFIDNWGDMSCWLCIFIAVFCDGKSEKKDELAKINTARANTVTMWIMFVILGISGMYARFHTITASQIIIAMCSALALRSILFLIFDFVPMKESINE